MNKITCERIQSVVFSSTPGGAHYPIHAARHLFFPVGIISAIAIPMTIAMLSGCALVDTSLTREQRLYAAWIDYTVIATAAAEYCESPSANPETKAKIKMLDQWAYEALTEMVKGKVAEDSRLAYVAELVKTMKGLLE